MMANKAFLRISLKNISQKYRNEVELGHVAARYGRSTVEG
jgi:hypothetical protein